MSNMISVASGFQYSVNIGYDEETKRGTVCSFCCSNSTIHR